MSITITRTARSGPAGSRLRHRLRQRNRPPHPITPALVPVIAVDADVSPALEQVLLPTVLRAHAGDPDARDALYLAFRPKLARFVRRIVVPRAGAGQVGTWDREDVEQEAWIVFHGLVRTWTPDRPFGRYVLAQFPWRLHDAIWRGLARRGVPPRTITLPIETHATMPDTGAAADETRALLDAVALGLPPLQAVILRRHIGDGDPLALIARDLGVGRRTVTRHWRAVRDHLAQGVPDAPRDRRMA